MGPEHAPDSCSTGLPRNQVGLALWGSDQYCGGLEPVPDLQHRQDTLPVSAPGQPKLLRWLRQAPLSLFPSPLWASPVPATSSCLVVTRYGIPA